MSYTTRAAVLIHIITNIVYAACVHDWRMRAGNTERQAFSCFRRPGGEPASVSRILPHFERLPSAGLYAGTVAVGSTTDVAVIQTSQLDLMAVNTTTAAVLWTTYNVSWHDDQQDQPAAAATDLLRLRGRGAHMPVAGVAVLRGLIDGDDDPDPDPGPPQPDYLVTGALDESRGLLLVQDTSSLYALRMAATSTQSAGAVAWTIGLDGHDDQPLWQGVAGSAAGLMVLPPPAGTTKSLQALLLLSVYSPIGGVVTANWLAAVALDVPRVLWVLPVIPERRSSCAWPPATYSDAVSVTLYLTCDTDKHGASTKDTAVLAVSFPAVPPADPDAPCNATLLWRKLLPVPPPLDASNITQLPYFTPPVLDSSSETVWIGSSLPGAPGLYRLNASSGVVASFTPTATTAGGACNRGWAGGAMVPFNSRVDATNISMLVGLTPDGGIGAVDVASGATVWCVGLPLPPLSPYSNWNRYPTSQLTQIEAGGVSSLWWTWSNNNRSSGLVGVRVDAGGSNAFLVYSGWPQASGASTAGIGSAALVAYSTIPVQVPSKAKTELPRLLLLGSSRIPFLADVDVAVDVAVAAASASVTPVAEITSLGAVSISPIIVTQRGSGDQHAVLAYVGSEDGTLRVFNASTQRHDASHDSDSDSDSGESSSRKKHAPGLLWSWTTGDEWSDLNGGTCTGVWPATGSSSPALLVCASWNGDIHVWNLLSGGAPAAVTNYSRITLALESYWRHLYGEDMRPIYIDETVLLDDPLSPSGYSLLFVGTPSLPLRPSPLALVRLPLPVTGGAVLNSHQAIPYIVYNVTCRYQDQAASFSRLLRVNSTSLAAGVPQAVAFVGVGSWPGVVQAHDVRSGAVVWSNMLAPTQPSYWVTQAMVYDSAAGLLLLGFTHPVSVHEDEDVGCVAAANASTGQLVWRTLDLCIIGRDGLASDGQRVYVTCENAGPYGLPGKIAILSLADGGAVVAWAGQPDDAMASGPSLLTVDGSNHTNGTKCTSAVLYGQAGGAITVSDAASGAAVAPVVTLPHAATAIPYQSLNVYPAFTTRLTVDSDGMIYAAAGDDRAAYLVSVPGFTGRACGSASASPTPLPSPSQPPAGRSDGDGSNTAVAAALSSLGIAVTAAAAGVWGRRRGAMPFYSRLSSAAAASAAAGTEAAAPPSPLLADAYAVLQQEAQHGVT